MKLVDLHCDTIGALMNDSTQDTLLKNSLCIDLDGMKKAETLVQFFACFVNVEDCDKGVLPDKWDNAYQYVKKMIGRMRQEENELIQVALSCEKIQKNQAQNVISAVMTVEEGGVLNNRMERLEELYQNGIRLITLTWNYENCLAFPNSRDKTVMEKGLKSFGFETIERMNELGMLVDVSHLSDGGFWDCIRQSKAPVIASHSNARALCDHPRNLSDEMLKALADKGGVAGLNFFPSFLLEKGPAELSDIARHACHMINVAGEDVVSIGTDFDGFEPQKSENYIYHVSQMERVWEAFKKAGITERQIDKIQSQNALRVMQEVLG